MPAVNKHSQRIQRLEFANAYRHWDEDVWKEVMFSDEAKNMEEWKREITELWTPRMRDSDYLQKLVASMPKRQGH
jgi:predicted unusual protein kinase regulating ubiquinone biosynthesis (AarF/ABC1/UbiB family)